MRKYFFRKKGLTMLVGILVLCAFSPAIDALHTNLIKPSFCPSTTTSLVSGFILDQHQSHEGPIHFDMSNEEGDFLLAQSFKPTKTPLAKIELFGKVYPFQGTSVTPNPLKVSITKNGEDDLTSIIIDELPSTQQWFTCDFEDIEVTPGETYYILIDQEGYGTFTWYGNYQNDYYPPGNAFSKLEYAQSWVNLSMIGNFDFCFKTYTYGENSAPNAPSITGPTKGKPGVDHTFTLSALDDDNDDVYYIIDWGDGHGEEEIGPYDSGKEISVTHQWTTRATYTILVKARDVNSNEGPEATLSMRIPRSKEISDLWQRFFQPYHYLYRFLSTLLKEQSYH
jgi:hypothetical protein